MWETDRDMSPEDNRDTTTSTGSVDETDTEGSAVDTSTEALTDHTESHIAPPPADHTESHIAPPPADHTESHTPPPTDHTESHIAPPPTDHTASHIPPPADHTESHTPPPPADHTESHIAPPPTDHTESHTAPPPTDHTESHTPPPPTDHTESHTVPPPTDHTESHTAPPPADHTESHTVPPPTDHTESHTPPPTDHTESHTAPPPADHTESHTVPPTDQSASTEHLDEVRRAVAGILYRQTEGAKETAPQEASTATAGSTAPTGFQPSSSRRDSGSYSAERPVRSVGARPYRPGFQRTGSDSDDKEYRKSDSGERRHRTGHRFRNRVYSRHKVDKIRLYNLEIDYKKPEVLRRFVTERGKILPRRITGTSAKNQRRLVREIKRARILALLPMG